jgi:hypothetical protein
MEDLRLVYDGYASKRVPGQSEKNVEVCSDLVYYVAAYQFHVLIFR